MLYVDNSNNAQRVSIYIYIAIPKCAYIYMYERLFPDRLAIRMMRCRVAKHSKSWGIRYKMYSRTLQLDIYARNIFIEASNGLAMRKFIITTRYNLRVQVYILYIFSTAGSSFVHTMSFLLTMYFLVSSNIILGF